ncbi:MAG: tryptophan--tRNA ligase [Anaplasma sp.]
MFVYARRWIDLQNSNRCLFCVVDLHALTTGKPTTESGALRSRAEHLVAAYIACGIDPEKSVLFLQSSVSEHSELCWILGCVTPVGWLNRMTQFKDKSQSGTCSPNMGLYGYPILMAADILLYKADTVPVGNDQQQHIELTQNIAKAFNAEHGVDYFPIPQALAFDDAARIMSFRDGKKKMSKSDVSDFSRINLSDSDDDIVQKVKRATTDSIAGFSLDGLSDRPEMCNLVNIFSTLGKITKAEVCREFGKSSTKEFKDALSDLLIREIAPIRERIKELVRDNVYIQQVLVDGNSTAKAMAHKHITEIRKIVGLSG